MDTTFTSMDDYIDRLEAPERAALERIRSIVKKHVPDAVETISYTMPTFKYKNRPLLHFAAFKNHMSIFPTAGPTDVLREKLKQYVTAKGTIHFTLDNELPESLIIELLDARLAEVNK